MEYVRAMRTPSMAMAPWIVPLAFSLVVGVGCHKRAKIDETIDKTIDKTNDSKSAIAEKLSGLADKSAVPDKDEPMPQLQAAAFLFQPSFKTDSGLFKAGKAVAVKVPSAASGVMVLSCMHILGPAGGLPSQLAPNDLPRSLKEIKLIDIHGREIAIGPALAVPGAEPFALPDASTDISAFAAPSFLAMQRALELGADKPSVGDSVWVLARVVGGAPPTTLLHHGFVRRSDDQLLAYELDNNALNLTATSGAAVLNTHGQVVGLNLGGGLVGKKLIAFANPITSVRKKIELALVAAK